MRIEKALQHQLLHIHRLAEESELPLVSALLSQHQDIVKLVLAAYGEDDAILGTAVFCEVETAGKKQLFLAGLCVAQQKRKQGIGTALLHHAHTLALEMGYDWILAIDQTDYLQKHHQYECAAAMGFLPLLTVEDGRDYKAFRLHEHAPAPCGAVDFPPELEHYCESAWFQYHTHLTEEEYRKVIFTTRSRRRWVERVVLLVYFVICLLLGHYLDRDAPFLVGGLCAGLLINSFIRPRRHTKKSMEMLRRKFGSCEWDAHLFFTDRGVVVYQECCHGGHMRFYDNYRELYLKPNFLFLMTEHATGEFMMYRDIADRDALISFLKEKCPELRIKK